MAANLPISKAIYLEGMVEKILLDIAKLKGMKVLLWPICRYHRAIHQRLLGSTEKS